MKVSAYMCNRCYGRVVKKQIADDPEFKLFRWACEAACRTEYGTEWVVPKQGLAQVPPVLNLLRWPGDKPPAQAA